MPLCMSKMARLQTIQIKGENCKHKWRLKGESVYTLDNTTCMLDVNSYCRVALVAYSVKFKLATTLHRQGWGCTCICCSYLDRAGHMAF